MEIRVSTFEGAAVLRRAAEFLTALASDAEVAQQSTEGESPIEREIQALEPAQPDAPIGSVPPTPQETKPKRGRRPKNVEAPATAVADTQKAQGAEPPASAASTPSPAPVAPAATNTETSVAPAATEATHADVVAAATKVMEKVGNNTKGQQAVRDLLKPFGVNLLRELPAEKRGDFVRACEAAVK